MSASDFLENEILDHLFSVGAYTAPTPYFCLCTADPTDAGTGASMNEVANSGSYARKDASACFGTAAAGGTISNDAVIEFAAATGSWGTATHFAICDSGTYGAGNMILHGALGTPKTIASGDTPRFPIGDIDITAA
jgi:hypothetical protein